MGSLEMMGMVTQGGLGGVTVVGGWHENVMIDGVMGENGSGRRGQGAAELEAKIEI